MKNLVLVGMVAALWLGCAKNENGEKRAEEGSESAALVETFDRGSIAWNVSADGQVVAHVTDEGGKDVSKTTKGSIEWTEGSDVKRADLVWNDKASALVAQGPAPKGELTEIRYVLEPQGAPVHGVLDVPEGGLASLRADGEAAAKIDVSGVTAPHGGVVQVVGDQRVEIVADADSDEVRVYVLDTSFKPTVAVDAKITIAVGGASPEVIVLTAADGGAHFVGHWHVTGEPPRLTISVRRAGKAHVAVVGWKPGAKLIVDRKSVV